MRAHHEKNRSRKPLAAGRDISGEVSVMSGSPDGAPLGQGGVRPGRTGVVHHGTREQRLS
ncbi:hypothetical protein ABK046_35995 [Streptomyces caeruleatus]